MSTTAVESATPSEVVGAVREQLLDLLDTMWAVRRPEELLGAVEGLEKLRSVLDAVELRVISEIEATSAGKVEGWSSTRRFLEAVAGDFQGAGRAGVELAQAIDGDFGRVGEDLANASISRTQAEIIVRAVRRLPVKKQVRDDAVALLLELAHELPATDLKRSAQHLVAVLDPDGSERDEERKLAAEERAAHLHRFLSITDDGMGGVRIKGRATTEAGAIVRKALMSLSGPVTGDPGACGGPGACPEVGCAHDGRDVRDHGARLVDALVDGCRKLMDADVLPTSHGTRPRLTLTMELDKLREGIGSATLDTGESLGASAVRRLACDCDVIPAVLGGHGEILDVGRMQRLVTMVIWLALVLRDGHCTFPGCNAPPVACDAHHIEHWLDGGITSLENLCLLCRTHHTIIHQTPWEVRLNPIDKLPEFLPPARVDPERRPIRRRRARDPDPSSR